MCKRHIPKYRLLSIEELQNLEKEFISYLVINGITNDDWEKFKIQNKSKTTEITSLFSDVVFEKIMRNAKYLLKIEATAIFAFKCDDTQIQLVNIETSDESYDFTVPESLGSLKSNPPSDLKGYSATKEYKQVRELEIFSMIQNGCNISDHLWYDTLLKML
ncbi:MAG: DUF6495 family protein [Saprospiraceae bacterium]